MLALVLIIASALSCSSAGKKRPFGYMRLGPVNEMLSPETFMEQKGILLQRDDRGFYAMSTYCTYDLARLVIKSDKENGQRRLVSRFSKSTYDMNGKVLSGPAVSDLPFYKLKMAVEFSTPPGEAIEVKVDNLYVKIGDEVSPDWRLNVPTINSTP